MHKIGQHRRQLEKMRADLLKQLENAEGLQQHESLRDSTQELSVVDNHPADTASENYERAKDISLHEKNQLILKKVEEALERMAQNRYGTCENCGKPISNERLDAVPYAEFCLECKKEAEGVLHDYPRPVEELVLMSPFARSFMDEKDYTGYDGEDAWQDVACYNKLPHVYYEEVGEDDETIGYVEESDRISNKQYKEQLPG
jgi:YteA family regulatory protein